MIISDNQTTSIIGSSSLITYQGGFISSNIRLLSVISNPIFKSNQIRVSLSLG